MTTLFRSLSLAVLALGTGLGGSAAAQGPVPVRVTVYEAVEANRVTYHYAVTNSGDRPVTIVTIGQNVDTGDFEFGTAPLGWTSDGGIAPGTIGAPAGWTPALFTVEESDKIGIEWRADPGLSIAPGQTVDGFTVALAAPADMYQSGGWAATDDLAADIRGVFERVPTPAADDDITGVIVPGTPVTLTFPAAGKNARLVFSAAAGDRISLLANAVTLAAGSIFIVGPDGEQITSAVRVAAGATAFMEPVPIHATGTHTLVVDPDGASTGALTLALYIVPPDVTATLTAGTPVTVNLDAPGQNARLVFAAVADQRINVTFANVTIPSALLTLLAPDGAIVTTVELDSSGGMIDGVTAPVTGSYAILVDPVGPSAGHLTATLYDSPDVVGSIVPSGPPVTVQIGTIGQRARLTFSGSAGQRVSLLVDPYTVNIFAEVSIVAPGGTVLSSGPLYSGRNFHDPVTLPASGTYTIVVDPQEDNVGSATLTLYDVPPDITGSMEMGGAPLTVTTLVPGQNAALTFTGSAGQHMTLQLSNVTIGSGAVRVLNPDASSLAVWSISTAGGSILDRTLPATGSYTIVVDPRVQNTGSITLTLFDPSEVLASITPGGPPVTVTTTTPGQNARVTFSGAAGQRVSLHLTGVTMGGTTCCTQVSMVNPDGTVLAPSAYFGTAGAFVDTRTLSVAGTYAILIDPDATSSGSVTLRLYDVPADVSGTIAIGGAPVTVNSSVPGQNGRLTFAGTAGQHVTLQMSAVSIASTTVSILNPDGSVLATAADIGTSGGSISDRILSTTGTYAIVVDPSVQNTGGITFALTDATNVLTITPGGSPVTVTTTAGETARITFSGSAGQRVSLRLTGVTIAGSPCCSALVSILKPDGTALVPLTYFGTNGAFIDTRTLPVSGTYTIVIDPEGTNAGSVTLQLYDVPADVTSTIQAGGSSVTVATTTAGQAARITFSGSAGQRVSLKLTSVTIPGSPCCSALVSILKPDGTALVTLTYFGTNGAFIDTRTLPVSGTYTIVIDPEGTNTGGVTLQLYDVPADVTSTIQAGGSSVTVATTTAGQAARITFSGSAGQRVSLRLTSVTIAGSPCCSALVSILKPDGTALVPLTYFGTNGAFIDTRTLPVSGTYTIVIDPDGMNTGGVTLQLYDVPVDVTSSIAAGGGPVTVGTTTLGQNARITFSGSAGQRVSLALTSVTIAGSTCCSALVSILKPDGTALVSAAYFGTNGAFIDTRTLPASGTYTIVIDPDGTNTGGVTLQLYDVPSDTAAAVAIGDPGAAITIGTPGQNASVTFAAAAGQQVTVRITGNTAGWVTIKLLRPDGSMITNTFQGGSSFNLGPQTLAVAGTYTIGVDPNGANTGILNVHVTTP